MKAGAKRPPKSRRSSAATHCSAALSWIGQHKCEEERDASVGYRVRAPTPVPQSWHTCVRQELGNCTLDGDGCQKERATEDEGRHRRPPSELCIRHRWQPSRRLDKTPERGGVRLVSQERNQKEYRPDYWEPD